MSDAREQAGATGLVVSTGIESVVYGAYVMTHAVGMWILLWRPQPASVKYRNIAILTASTLIFAVATVHFILALNLLTVGFNSAQFAGAGLLLKAYNTTSLHDPIAATRFAVYVTQTLLADLFLVYRLYVVWDRRRIIIAGPSALIVTSAFCGYLGPLSPRGLVPTFYFFTFLTNIACSVLIIYRVLISQGYFLKMQTQFGMSLLDLYPVVSALVESAALYSATSLVLFITFFASPDVVYPACANIFTVLIGFIFSFIVIRVGLRSSRSVARADTESQGPMMTDGPIATFASPGH